MTLCLILRKSQQHGEIGLKMIINKSARQSGKTTRILQKLKRNTNAIMIVPTENIRHRLLVANRDITPERIYNACSYASISRHCTPDTVVYIDEVGHCMEMMLNLEVKMGTHTDNPVQHGVQSFKFHRVI